MFDEKELTEAITQAETEEQMTCEEVFALCEPYLEVARPANPEYEKIRADYAKCVEIYKTVEGNIEKLKAESERLEKEMNSSVPNGITEQMFSDYYGTVRDLHYNFGHYTAILNRRAASAVVFYDLIKKELPN